VGDISTVAGVQIYPWLDCYRCVSKGDKNLIQQQLDLIYTIESRRFHLIILIKFYSNNNKLFTYRKSQKYTRIEQLWGLPISSLNQSLNGGKVLN
jgi:hypothetical protein